MANGFDKRGALIGAGLLVLFVMIGIALFMPLRKPVTIKINLPPVAPASR
ncbi:MAG TPA: hypothetical protein VGG29_17655 [Caulobacteraceae bacterium]|jgi:hypothetical protein